MKGKAARSARARGQSTEVTVFVGREGVTAGVAAELAEQLKARGLVKVRLSREACEERGREAVAGNLAEKAGAVLVEVRGFTALLARRK